MKSTLWLLPLAAALLPAFPASVLAAPDHSSAARAALRGYSPAACAAPPSDLLAERDWTLSAPGSDAASLQIVPGTDLPDGAAREMRVTVNKAVDPFYNIQVTAPLAAAPKPGDRIRYSFWGRAAGRNTLRAVVETAGAPWTAIAQQTIALTPGWKRYRIQETVSAAIDQPLAARLQVGAQEGTMEFAGVTVEDLGEDPEIASARAAVVLDAVQARIRRYRMGTLTVAVTDVKGRPVRNASVTVTMKRHAFLFGCNFFNLRPTDNSSQQIAYRDRFTSLFNYATLPFYWGAFEPREGEPNFPRLDAMIDWCLAHGITPKAHPLVWHEVYPGWAPEDPDTAIPELHRRVTEIVTHERDRIHYYDVVNEAANGASYSPANGESLWLKRDGAPAVVETALGWARDAAAGAPDTFIYNDYETGSANVALLTQMRKAGNLPDAVGIQSHMHAGVWPPERVWQVCQTFSRFGRPVHFTETTVLSGPRRTLDYTGPPATDWDTTPGGEQAQADYVARFYSILFSHPSLRAITWWDFSDQGAWLGAPAGLVRRDMSPKPAYDRLMRLIHHDWWTDASGKSDAKGKYALRAFYGDYEIAADDGHAHHVTKTISFPEGSGPLTVSVALP